MKAKRTLALTLGVSLSLSLLSGCGGGQPSGSVSGSPAPGGETGTKPASIVWAGWSGEEEASKEIFQKMMETYETNTGNDVTWVGWTWADTAQQLLIRNQGSEQLDIA